MPPDGRQCCWSCNLSLTSVSDVAADMRSRASYHDRSRLKGASFHVVTTAGDFTTWKFVPPFLPASPASQVRAKCGLLPDKSYLYLRRSVTVGWSRWVQCSMHEPYMANARAFQYTQHGRLPGRDGWHVDASSSPRDATKTHQQRCQRSCTGQKGKGRVANRCQGTGQETGENKER